MICQVVTELKIKKFSRKLKTLNEYNFNFLDFTFHPTSYYKQYLAEIVYLNLLLIWFFEILLTNYVKVFASIFNFFFVNKHQSILP